MTEIAISATSWPNSGPAILAFVRRGRADVSAAEGNRRRRKSAVPDGAGGRQVAVDVHQPAGAATRRQRSHRRGTGHQSPVCTRPRFRQQGQHRDRARLLHVHEEYRVIPSLSLAPAITGRYDPTLPQTTVEEPTPRTTERSIDGSAAPDGLPS